MSDFQTMELILCAFCLAELLKKHLRRFFASEVGYVIGLGVGAGEVTGNG
jgi:hypothetical protein